MFDMNKIGKKIAGLRKTNNMTQMELADKLGISFQAVSNWERGNTIPDVSKLPELAELFHVSVDELLSGEGALVKAVLNNSIEEYIEEGKITEQEVADTLPLLKPDQAEVIIDKVDVASFNDISSLLPFMAPERIYELAKEYVERGNDLNDILPFLHETDVAFFANKLMECEKSIQSLLPFMSETHVRDFAIKTLENGKSINSFLPFLAEEDVTQLALIILRSKK